MNTNKIEVVGMGKESDKINKVSIDPIESIITSFDKKHQKRVIRYLIKSLRKKRKEIR